MLPDRTQIWNQLKVSAAVIVVFFVIVTGLVYHTFTSGIVRKEYPQNYLSTRPPMGWNGWNRFRCSPELNEESFKQMVDAFIQHGLKDAGYTYVNLDDCWQVDRDENDNIVVDKERFPGGIKVLSDYVHSKGLKFGIYTSAGRITCEKRPGSYGFEKKDVQTYADWGVDYIKVDWCGIEYLDTLTQYKVWKEAIADVGRPMILSIAIANIDYIPNTKVWMWGREAGYLWRTAIDINDYWPDVLRVFDKNAKYAEYSGPGGWNDSDMLQVGNGNMTFEEYRTHFTLWAVSSSPLILGNDLRNMSEEIQRLVTQPEVIAINQDPLGVAASLVSEKDGLQVWSKQIESKGKRAVVLLNRTEEEAEMTVFWKDLNLLPLVMVRDVWQEHEKGISKDSYTTKVPSHGVVLLKVQGFDSTDSVSIPPLPDVVHEGYLFDQHGIEVTDNDSKNTHILKDPQHRGLIMSPFSNIRYHLNGLCQQLASYIEVQHASLDPADITFKVYTDGRLALSKQMLKTDFPTRIAVDVSKVRVVDLFIEPKDQYFIDGQEGLWGDLYITCKK
jgi:alpha-galactosidase